MSAFKIGKLKFKDGAAKPAALSKKAKKVDAKDEEEEQDVVV